ncbi:MAG: TolC family protein, partial [Myxococcales bacterium]|nr:TolC family protein [Polyangiaceae bacterium]MDW8248664.1 TolC family protein [Myxococcales bacterium]
SKLEEASAAEGLPPPMAMAQLWQAPLRMPFLYGHGSMLMLGLQQSIPPGKVRRAEVRAALEEVRVEIAELVAQERELAVQAGMLAIDLKEARERVALHEGHRKLLGDLAAAVRARQSTGAGVLLELVRVEREEAAQHAEEEMARGDERRARNALNLLLGAPPEAPLELREEPQEEAIEPLPVLLERARGQHPEILAAEAAVRRDAARAEAARHMAGSPMVTIGVNYGWMGPDDPQNHTWGAMFSMSLPWLSKGQAAMVRAREAERDARRSDGEAVRLQVEQRVASAHARASALTRRYVVLRERLLPASRRAVEAARSGYVTGAVDTSGWIEAVHELREVELMEVSTRAELERARLELVIMTTPLPSLSSVAMAVPRKETP